jgi:hypothetical protein
VRKPFIPLPPDIEESEIAAGDWKSGELCMYYYDWLFHKNEERIFDCNSSGVPHQHCMDVLIAEKVWAKTDEHYKRASYYASQRKCGDGNRFKTADRCGFAGFISLEC